MKNRFLLSVVYVGIASLSLSVFADDLQTDDTLLLQLLHEHTNIRARQPWRPIQEEVRDTVVQIFAQIVETDLLQPYKTPHQYSVRGSGFFINSEGDLITNAHVVDQAIALWIQIPSLGKRLLDVKVVGVCYDRDIALLRLSPESLALVHHQLGKVPYLKFGDSDFIKRADEVLALGYPLGQESLKSTTGVISGREMNFIQMSAPINPGSSGGPLLNIKGEVVGVNSAGRTEAQNVGYIIPVNDVKIILPELYKVPLFRKPYLGILIINATESLVRFLGNPAPGGAYVVDVAKDSPMHKAGVCQGDMIYEINGFHIDVYGDMQVPWSEDKVSLGSYISRLIVGETIECVVYRKGQRITTTMCFDCCQPLPIRKIYPGYDVVDYEACAGMVVMELTLNHIKLLANQAPGLLRYTEGKYQAESVLVITHIFPNSQLFRSRTVQPGIIINEVNGIPVHTLSDFRKAFKESYTTGYVTIKAYDSINKSSDNIFVVLPFDVVLAEEASLARSYHFPISDLMRQ